MVGQSPLKGTISKQVDKEHINTTTPNQSTSNYMESKEWEIIESDRSPGEYQVDLWESFEIVGYPEFWTSTQEEWMFETYEGYYGVPIIDGERFILLFDGEHESCIDTLITPILDIQSGDEFSFYLGQWESYVTTGPREPVEILYGPSINGPWTYISEVDVSAQTMWDLQQFTVDVSDAAGQNFLAFACEGYFIMDLVEGPARYYYQNDLMSISLLGNSAPTANMPTEYSFSIKNVTNILVAGSEYTVKLMQAPDTELSYFNGVDLDIWEENTFTFNVSFPDAGAVEDVYAVIECTSDANLSNNESNHIIINVVSDEYDYIYIGDPDTDWGNYYEPFQTQYDFNSYSEIIYWKDVLNYPAGEIIGLDYEFHNADDTENVPVTIWMTETEYECFNYKHWGGPDLITADHMYKVFEGIINVNEVDGHLYIPLDNGFTYTGEGNLVVLVRGLSNGPENEWIGWKATIVGQCDDYGSVDWNYHWYDTIDPNDISNYHWTFVNGTHIPNGTFVMNSNLGGLTGSVNDESDNPIEGVKIEIAETNLYTYSDAYGNYELPKILHGDHNVLASRFGYNSNVQAVSISIDNTSTLNFILSTAQSVDITGNIVKLHNAAPIEDASISLTYNDYSNNEITGTSSDNGNFSITVTENIEYQLEITALGYAPYFDVISVSSSDINLGTIQLTESFSNVFNVVSNNDVENAIISWFLPDTELQDTIILDDDNGMGGMGYYDYIEGWTGNLFEMNGLHTITGIQWESTGPKSDTCTDYITIDIFTPNGDLLHEGLPVYTVGYRWNTYMLENPVTIDGDFFVMMHSHESQATDSFLTRWDWDGQAENYTNVIYYYSPTWPENNGFIRVFDYDPFDGTGCLMIRPIIAEEEVVKSVRDERTITGYNVYKGETSDISNIANWPVLNSAPVNALDYIDNTWPPEDTNSRIYAIEAVYADGNSNYCFSTTLQLGMPYFVSEPVTTANVDEVYTYFIEVAESRNNAVSVSSEIYPDGLTLVDNGDGTAVLSGIIAGGGVFDVVIVASNGAVDVNQEFSITVAGGEVPVIVSEPITLVGENEDYDYLVEVSYSGSNNVTILEGDNFPSWLTLTDNGDQTATVNGSTTDLGDYDIEIITTDGANSSNQEFIITVAAVPVFISEPQTTIRTGQPYEYLIEVSYNGSEACEIISQGTLPSWLTLTDHDDNTATLSGIPPDVDSYDIELLAQGEYYSDSQNFTIDVLVDINESSMEEINIYPNPTQQKITIDNVEGAQIVVLNSSGIIVNGIGEARASEMIDFSNNPNGLYFIRIIKDKNTKVHKVNLIK